MEAMTHAAVGVIQHPNGLVLLAERPAGKAWAGYWEFPGGKIEAGETPKQALVRELQEEIGITPTKLYPWLRKTFQYPAKYDAQGGLEAPAKTVMLHCFLVLEWSGELQSKEQQRLSWQSPQKRTVSPVLPANDSLFDALDLPPICAITQVAELGEKIFFERLRHTLPQGLQMILVREKNLSPQAQLSLVEHIIEIASPYATKILVSNHVEIALESRAHGVHFSHKTLMTLNERPKDIRCGASCHDAASLAKAAELNLDYAFLSPIKTTQTHPHTPPLGWETFESLVKEIPMPIYALGGLNAKDLHEARAHGAHGVAMLRGAWG